MKYIFLLIPFLLNAGILEDRMQAKADSVCYYKSLVDGSNDGSLPPSAFSGTLGSSSERQIFEKETTAQSTSNTYCDDWSVDPFVLEDYETFQVVADTSCDVFSWRTTETFDGKEYTTTHWKETVVQKAFDVNCDSGCEIPKDSHGNNYDLNTRIDEHECTIEVLNRLYKEVSPNSSYVVSDAMYLNCDDVTPSATGCYYILSFDGFPPDNNETNQTEPDDMNLTPVTNELKKVNEAIDNMSGNLGSKLDRNSQTLGDIEGKLEEIRNQVFLSGNKIVASEINTTLAVMKSNDLLGTISNSLRQELNDSRISDGIAGTFEDLNVTKSLLDDFKDAVLGVITAHSAPVFSGIGEHIFSANIFGGVVQIDLSMVESLRPTFDIFWLLLLAYLNFKTYFYVLTEFLRKA